MDKIQKKVAVIGAGVAGLTCAYRLTKKGVAVKVFESSDKLGGLARTTFVGGMPLEIYYHHFFSSDAYFFDLCAELGIANKIVNLKAKMGYLSDGEVYEFGTPAALFKFKPLTFIDKIRCIISSLAINNEKSLEKMDKCTASDWLLQHSGKNVFNAIWKPMLIQKFGKYFDKVPMAWIWRKVHVRMLSKKSMFKEEKLAYLDGSTDLLIRKLKDQIIGLGGQVLVSSPVDSIQIKGVNTFIVKTKESEEPFQQVISTIPAVELNKLVKFPENFNEKLVELKQLGVICLVVVLKERLTDFYWLNIGDNSFPFGLIVEHTNFCRPAQYGNKHILYISKYFNLEDKNYAESSDEQLKDRFLKNLGRINKDFNASWVEDVKVFRENCAQPIIETNYLQRKPAYKTTINGFYWMSTSHIYPDDRGVNYSIKMAEELCREVIGDLK